MLVIAALLMSIIVLAFKSIDELKNKICKNDFMTDNFLPADFLENFIPRNTGILKWKINLSSPKNSYFKTFTFGSMSY